MIEELNKTGIYFTGYAILDGIENSVMESIGLSENKGHVQYCVDIRPSKS